MERGYWIRSKPVYDSLVWREYATGHVVIAQGDGGLAVLKLFQQKCPREPIKLLFADEDVAAKKYGEIIQTLVPEGLAICESEQAVLAALKEQLPECLMGTQFYVAGSERFIWAVIETLNEYGVQEQHVAKELSGTLARSVYCVHCKTISENVHHSIHPCDGCGRHLFVRDHFSRRLGAYMGVMVDAEEPGNIPAKEEIYP
ncbi:dimethylamine monooxygenase subunit DmmA family protein [Methylophaga sp.]|uniref:dimethylamine monooxygenase subunit DmmA family protein n=1 Tax=Methylophaga sp. TaxID=2024840 RepID=UPI003F6A0DA5